MSTESAKAECVCGWSTYTDDRATARHAARAHRATVAVAATDLSAFTELMASHCLPLDLHPGLGRLSAALGARDNAGDQVEVPLADLLPLLREANRPWLYAERPFLPRLITTVQTASHRRVGMLDTVRAYCELVASSHGLTWTEWLARVTPEI